MEQQPVVAQPGLFDPPEPKPPKKLLRDPAMAAAIAKCVAFRVDPSTRVTREAHPQRCRWCEFPFEKKLASLLEFNRWAGWDALDRPPGNTDPDWPELEPTVEAFMRLPIEEQQRLVEKAAGYPQGTYEKNTGYEYWRTHPVVPEVQGSASQGSTSASQGSTSANVESVSDDEKTAGTRSSEAQPHPVGGRPGPGQRRGRGIGGPETAEGAEAGGLVDREAEASRPGSRDLSVPTDRYRDKNGDDLPF